MTLAKVLSPPLLKRYFLGAAQSYNCKPPTAN